MLRYLSLWLSSCTKYLQYNLNKNNYEHNNRIDYCCVYHRHYRGLCHDERVGTAQVAESGVRRVLAAAGRPVRHPLVA